MNCELHDSHDTLTHLVDYNGQKYIMFLYDWGKYLDPKSENWCPANDVISENIETYGFWEVYETMLFDQILATGGNNNFIDIGSQLGWYSLRAADKGFNVYSIEADKNSASLLKTSSKKNGFNNIFVDNIIINKNSPKIKPKKTKLVKIDIEGNEQYALIMLEELFKKNKIEYAIFEFSTALNDSYPGILKKLNQYGYTRYCIPVGDENWLNEYAKDPLGTLLKTKPVTVDDVNSWTRQENLLFL